MESEIYRVVLRHIRGDLKEPQITADYLHVSLVTKYFYKRFHPKWVLICQFD